MVWSLVFNELFTFGQPNSLLVDVFQTNTHIHWISFPFFVKAYTVSLSYACKFVCMGTSLFFFVSFYPKTKKTANVSVSLKRLRVLYCIWERVFDDKSILTSNHTTRQRANDVYADLHCWGYFEYILNAYDSYHVVSGSFPPCTIAWKHTHTILYIRAHTHTFPHSMCFVWRTSVVDIVAVAYAHNGNHRCYCNECLLKNDCVLPSFLLNSHTNWHRIWLLCGLHTYYRTK